LIILHRFGFGIIEMIDHQGKGPVEIIAKEGHMAQAAQQQVESLAAQAEILHGLHQHYITDDWGVDRLKGKTYRQRGEEEWVDIQTALARLRQQVSEEPVLVNRTDLEQVTRNVQAFRIRLTQCFAELPKDTRLREDSTRADSAWNVLNQADHSLYRTLG
jgi:hypothetical protein